MGYYVIEYLSEPYTLQEDQTIYGKLMSAGELLVISEYLSIMKPEKNWHWKQHGKNQSFIISTIAIVHTCIEV